MRIFVRGFNGCLLGLPPESSQREQELEAARNSYATQLGCEVGDIHESIRNLQAQNKALVASNEVLWELMDLAESALRYVHAEYVRDVGYGYPEADNALAAIQKAKEGK
jgi:hypothetical protein